MDVRQCPRCELRFEHEAELKSHMVIDHNLDPEALERDYPVEEADEALVQSADDASSEPTPAEAPATDTDR